MHTFEDWTAILASGAPVSMVIKQPLVAATLHGLDQDLVETCSAEMHKMCESIRTFTTHTSRNSEAVRFAKKWGSLYEAFTNNPNRESHFQLQRYATHASIMEKSMKKGRPWHRHILSELLNEQSDMSRFASTLSEDLESDTDHDAFIKGFEKAFKVKVQRHEGVSNGVYVYINAEDTATINTQLLSASDYMELITKNMGYICVRRGQPSDIDYGPYSERLSKWVFVRSHSMNGDEEEDCGGETLKKGPTMSTVLIGDSKVRVLNTARYSIWEDHAYGYYARGIGQYRDRISHRYTETLSEARTHAEAEILRVSEK